MSTVRADVLQPLLHHATHLRAERAEDAGQRLDDRHVGAVDPRGSGDLGADEPAAEHQDRARAVEVGGQTYGVAELAQHPDLGLVGDDRRHRGAGASGEDHHVGLEPLTVRGLDRTVLDSGRADPGSQGDVERLDLVVVGEEGLARLPLPGQDLLGQRRPVVRELVLVAQDGDRAVEARLAGLLRRAPAGQSGADDQHRPRLGLSHQHRLAASA